MIWDSGSTAVNVFILGMLLIPLIGRFGRVVLEFFKSFQPLEGLVYFVEVFGFGLFQYYDELISCGRHWIKCSHCIDCSDCNDCRGFLDYGDCMDLRDWSANCIDWWFHWLQWLHGLQSFHVAIWVIADIVVIVNNIVVIAVILVIWLVAAIALVACIAAIRAIVVFCILFLIWIEYC